MTSDKPDEFQWPAPPPPPARVSEAIHCACTKDLRPRVPHSPTKRVLFSIATSGGIFALLLAVGWMRHPPKNAVYLALLGAFAWGIAQAIVLFLAVGKPPGRRFSKALRWTALLAVPAVYILYLVFLSGSVLSFQDFLVTPRSLRSTVVCGVHTLLFGGAASFVLFLLWRRTDPFCPKLTGALTGLAGGLVGAVALDLVCVSNEGWHLWLGHGLTLLAFVFGGWLAGRRWIAP
jgi:hypothetical protein